jgi:hypothetical protein
MTASGVQQSYRTSITTVPQHLLFSSQGCLAEAERAPALRAESEHDACERSTAELDAPSASQTLGCCKH